MVKLADTDWNLQKHIGKTEFTLKKVPVWPPSCRPQDTPRKIKKNQRQETDNTTNRTPLADHRLPVSQLE
jgi:hypothetical protein